MSFQLFNVGNILDAFNTTKVIALLIAYREKADVDEPALKIDPEFGYIAFSALKIIQYLIYQMDALLRVALLHLSPYYCFCSYKYAVLRMIEVTNGIVIVNKSNLERQRVQ